MRRDYGRVFAVACHYQRNPGGARDVARENFLLIHQQLRAQHSGRLDDKRIVGRSLGPWR